MACDATTKSDDELMNDEEKFTVKSSRNFGHTHTVQIYYVNIDRPPAVNTIIFTSSREHTHQISISPFEYKALFGGQTVEVESTEELGHSHTFRIKSPTSRTFSGNIR